MQEKRGLIISVVSGKGGVGKTMLAVALARELSTNTRTLLLDLDFFNRGLTGLMRHGRVLQPIALPTFLTDSSSSEPTKIWELVEVSPNLLHIRYPDLTPEQIQSLENSEVTQLAQALRRFLDDLVTISQCEAIIIDCHGGPDHLSFAACLVAEYSLLISEPDKITFYGTLHFLRQLRRVFPENSQFQTPDVRLVFNKVVPAFSAVFLRKFYDKEIARLFDNRPLLAIFPIEMYLTKEFERTPFLTAVFPFSLLAKKTRVLLRDLLQQAHPQCVPRSIRHALQLRLLLIRNSVGRTPWCADLNKVMAIIAVGGVLIFAADFYGRSVGETYSNYLMAKPVQTLEIIQYAQKHPAAVPAECSVHESWTDKLDCWSKHGHRDKPGGPFISDYYGDGEIRKIVGDASNLPNRKQLLLQDNELRSNPDKLIQDSFRTMQTLPVPGWFRTAALRLYQVLRLIEASLALTAAIWFLIVLVISWSIGIDRSFTYSARVRHRTIAFFLFIVAAALWFLPLLMLTAAAREAMRSVSGLRMISEQLITNRTMAALTLVSVAVAVAMVGDQWFKAQQNLRYERRRFEGFARVLFGCYILAIPVLFWKVVT
jgi:cellulose biosynthesis protein BcsQ